MHFMILKGPLTFFFKAVIKDGISWKLFMLNTLESLSRFQASNGSNLASKDNTLKLILEEVEYFHFNLF